MLTTKNVYIRGLVLTVAIFGLINCSKGSKNAAAPGVVVGPEEVPVTDSSYVDPTLVQTDATLVRELKNYLPLSDRAGVFTGLDFSTNDELLFSDSSGEGPDNNLLQALKTEMRKKNLDTNANKEFASRLTIKQVVVNPENPSAISAIFSIKRAGNDVAYVASGEIENSDSNKLTVASGPNDVVVTAQCMDASGTCHNVVLQINDKSQQQTRKAFAVFRSTKVDVDYFSSLPDNSTSAKKFVELLQNSKRRKKLPYIQNFIMESGSVAFGTSYFSIFSRVKNIDGNETIIPMFGTLATQKHDVHANIDMVKPKKGMLKDPSTVVFDPLVKTIKHFMLLQNDARGSIQVLLSFGADQQSGDSVFLTIMRLNVQQRALND